MSQSKLFIEKVIPPTDKLLPKNWLELLCGLTQFLRIGDTTSAAGFVNQVVSEDAPEDTSVLWTKIDGNGFPLGTFKFNDGEWLSITFTKGVTIQFYVGPAVIVHPHWRICDPDIVGSDKVNGVTIPQMRDRMLVMASPQEDAVYDIGDIGGEDLRKILTIHLEPHDHGVGNYTIVVDEVPDHTHTVGDWLNGEADEGSGGTANPIVGQTRQSLPAGKHTPIAALQGESALTGGGQDFDVRSLHFAVGFAIYVGIGDPAAC